jgi:hypothetical protein
MVFAFPDNRFGLGSNVAPRIQVKSPPTALALSQESIAIAERITMPKILDLSILKLQDASIS